MAQQPVKRMILSLAIAAALTSASTAAVADSADRIEELEARVAELEALVLQLVGQQEENEAAGVALAASTEAAAQEIAEAKVTEMMAAYQAAEAEKQRKDNFKIGGYIKSDVIFSDYTGGSVAAANAGRDFYIPATVPVGSNGESYLDFSAKESRINFKATHITDSGSQLGAFIEVDFLLSGQGDERISNSYSPRVRHAFMTYDKWLFGQTWMTFFNVAALPENLDFVGPAESTIFGRQTQIRYTNGPWMFSAENPETTVTPYGGAGRIVADDNRVPDLVGRYNFSGDWGSFTVAGLLRELRLDENIPGGVNDSTTGWGISASGVIKAFGADDFRFMASTGEGLGRYIGLNTANGAVITADGSLKAITQTGVFGSYRHFWNEKWRSNLTYGYLWVDNDTEYTGFGVTSDASSLHVNLIYSPLPKLDFGVEYLYANREIESGVDGDLSRFQFSAKYTY